MERHPFLKGVAPQKCHQEYSGAEKVFINMAYYLNGNEFASFMMGVASFRTKLKVIMSMPKIKFIKSALSTIRN